MSCITNTQREVGVIEPDCWKTVERVETLQYSRKNKSEKKKKNGVGLLIRQWRNKKSSAHTKGTLMQKQYKI